MRSKKGYLPDICKGYAFALPEDMVGQIIEREKGLVLSNSLQLLPDMIALSTIRSSSRFDTVDSSTLNINFHSSLEGIKLIDDKRFITFEEDTQNGLPKLDKELDSELGKPSDESNRVLFEDKFKVNFSKTSMVDRTEGEKNSGTEYGSLTKKTVTFSDHPNIIEYERDYPITRKSKPKAKKLDSLPVKYDEEPVRRKNIHSDIREVSSSANFTQKVQTRSKEKTPIHQTNKKIEKENVDRNALPLSDNRDQHSKRILNLKDLQINPKNYISKRSDGFNTINNHKDENFESNNESNLSSGINRASDNKQSAPSRSQTNIDVIKGGGNRIDRRLTEKAFEKHDLHNDNAIVKDSLNSSLCKIYQSHLNEKNKREHEKKFYKHYCFENEKEDKGELSKANEDSLQIQKDKRNRYDFGERALSNEIHIKRSHSSNDLYRFGNSNIVKSNKNIRSGRVNKSGSDEIENAYKSMFSKSSSIVKRDMMSGMIKKTADNMISSNSVLVKSIDNLRRSSREGALYQKSIKGSGPGVLHNTGISYDRHAFNPPHFSSGLRDRGGSIVSELINLKFKMNETYNKIKKLKSNTHLFDYKQEQKRDYHN